MEDLAHQAEQKGYAETLLGRRRIIPDINSANRTIKSAAERTAINAPIQGTAADMIKIAMINVDKLLEGSRSRPYSPNSRRIAGGPGTRRKRSLIPRIEAA